MLPPKSVPMSKGVSPAAMAAPAPPLDPPGERERSKGLRVNPCMALWVEKLSVNSGVLVFPRRIAPADLSRATMVASSSGTNARRPRVPQVGTTPAVSKQSLMVIGTPARGPTGSPDASRASMAAAFDRAVSSMVTNALSDGLIASIRRKWASTSSTLVVSRFLTRRARVRAESKVIVKPSAVVRSARLRFGDH